VQLSKDKCVCARTHMLSESEATGASERAALSEAHVIHQHACACVYRMHAQHACAWVYLSMRARAYIS
jgi:hypothetical protein